MHIVTLSPFLSGLMLDWKIAFYSYGYRPGCYIKLYYYANIYTLQTLKYKAQHLKGAIKSTLISEILIN